MFENLGVSTRPEPTKYTIMQTHTHTHIHILVKNFKSCCSNIMCYDDSNNNKIILQVSIFNYNALCIFYRNSKHQEVMRVASDGIVKSTCRNL